MNLVNSKQNSKGFLFTLIAAVLTAAASSLCCIGPLLYLLFGVSAAAFIGLSKLSWLQYPMMLSSLSLIGLGFWRIYFSKKPLCVGRISRRQLIFFYWLLTPIALILIFYPFVLPWILEFFE